MTWYSIRHIFLFERKPNGVNVFEERIVCFKAKSLLEAQAKASQEAEEYARTTNLTLHPGQEGYELDDGDLIDGQEVWSALYESSESLEEFFASRCGQKQQPRS